MAEELLNEALALDVGEDDFIPEPNLRTIADQKELKWIFVGGKGGVGKTTTSCSLGVMLSQVRESVLIISTDPAHNLSDAFSQKFGGEPKAVNGISNLFCMEVDPSASKKQMEAQMEASLSPEMAAKMPEGAAGALQGVLKDLTGSIPGIDELMSFAELMKSVNNMKYSCIIFDTAPTGHTLRLLSFPKTLESALGKVLGLKAKFGGMFSSLASMMGNQADKMEAMLTKFEDIVAVVKQINSQFKDPERTTFVCVCIPEFLSLFETERLVQELTKFEIDTHCIVVNQVLFADRGSACPKFAARRNLQGRYLEQIYDLYDTFNIVEMPLMDNEVRGVKALKNFSHFLSNPYALSEEGRGLTDEDTALCEAFYKYFTSNTKSPASAEVLIAAIQTHQAHQ